MFGLHVNKNKRTTIEEAIKEDINNYNLKTIQIFTHGPRSFTRTKLETSKVNTLIKKHKINLYIHGTYFSSIFSEKPATVAHLNDQLTVGDELNAHGLVIHVHKRTVDEVVKAFDNIENVLRDHKTILLFEPHVSKVTNHDELPDVKKSYETPEMINFTDNKINVPKKYYKFCIDSAHHWAMGENIKYYNPTREWLSRFKPGRIGLFHLNGSSNVLDSGKDVHAIPFSDHDLIWGGIPYEESGFRAFIEYAKSNNIDIVHEVSSTEKDFESNLKNCYELIKDYLLIHE